MEILVHEEAPEDVPDEAFMVLPPDPRRLAGKTGTTRYRDEFSVESGHDWILHAKTGWQARVEPNVGWWVGWVERPDGPVFFALNIDMPRKGDDLPKRESIARAILRSIGALPTD